MVARKPLAGTVAANVQAWGTGALNIDGCRVEGVAPSKPQPAGVGGVYDGSDFGRSGTMSNPHAAGRWPANVILDESQARELDQMSGVSQSRIGKPRGANSGEGWGMTATGAEYDDLGGASRFFKVAPLDDLDARFMYQAKAAKKERPVVEHGDGTRTAHPTVKPIALMRWLVRLVTPPGGTVLEPFAGSGATIEAALLEGFNVIGIEREAEYLPLIEQRIARCAAIEPDDDPDLFHLLDGGAA